MKRHAVLRRKLREFETELSVILSPSPPCPHLLADWIQRRLHFLRTLYSAEKAAAKPGYTHRRRLHRIARRLDELESACANWNDKDTQQHQLLSAAPSDDDTASWSGSAMGKAVAEEEEKEEEVGFFRVYENPEFNVDDDGGGGYVVEVGERREKVGGDGSGRWLWRAVAMVVMVVVMVGFYCCFVSHVGEPKSFFLVPT